MRTSGRLAITVAAIVVLGLLLAGCADPPGRQATAASSGSAPQPVAAAEMRWIDAVEQLLPAMNKIFTEPPPNTTPTALTALATVAGGCRRELTRIGAASARLRPVQSLVEQACQQYDKAATCFTAAARVRTASSTAELNTAEKQISRAFALADKGRSRLAEAQLKAAEISNGVGTP
jgi:hypothetical protein